MPGQQRMWKITERETPGNREQFHLIVFYHALGVIAELANNIAWDAVGAQIEPYLCQHA